MKRLVLNSTVFCAAILTFCILHFAFCIANAQFVYNNAFLVGNTGDDAGYNITSDAAGNIYCTGNYAFWVDIDPGVGTNYLNSNGGLDCYVAKYDASGALLVAFNIGGLGDDYIFSIKTDANSNIFITGRFRDTVDFAPGAAVTNKISSGGDDIFLAKYSPTGVLLWVNTFGGADDDEAFELAYDAGSGNVFITGSFESSTVDMDAGVGTQPVTNLSTAGLGYSDLFFAGYNAASGNYLWAFGIGGTLDEDGNGVTTDNSGNVFITGKFNSANVDFDPGAGAQLFSSAGSADIYIAKYNGSGAYQWAHRFGNAFGEIGYSLACDNTGNLYAGGYFNSDSVDFDPGAGTHYIHTGGVQDLYIIKLDNSGVHQWAFGVGDFNSEVAQDMAVTGAGDIFITGSFGHTVDFDPGVGTFNLVGDPNADGYLAQYNPNGNFVDAIPFTGNGFEFGTGVCVVPPNKVGVTGWFSTLTIDFDPGAGVQNLSVTGSNINWTDAFVATYSYAPVGINEQNNLQSSFDIYPNPAFQSLVISHQPDANNELKIFDVTGREVMKSEVRSQKSEIDISNLENGIYLVRLKTGNTIITQRFIKL